MVVGWHAKSFPCLTQLKVMLDWVVVKLGFWQLIPAQTQRGAFWPIIGLNYTDQKTRKELSMYSFAKFVYQYDKNCAIWQKNFKKNTFLAPHPSCHLHIAPKESVLITWFLNSPSLRINLITILNIFRCSTDICNTGIKTPALAMMVTMTMIVTSTT